MSQINCISNIDQSKTFRIQTERNNGAVKKSFSSYMEEAGSLDHIFERAAAKYNVPVNLLKAIGKAESDFNPNAVSRSGAQGVMQLMPATAASLGVKDAFDPEQNIMGGAKYISDLLKKYDGNVSLSLAAYNAGMGNVAKYGGIPPFKETQNYVVKVTKYMNQNLEAGQVARSKAAPSAMIAPSSSINNPYYIIPKASQLIGEESSDTFDSIFSEDDYLKLLDIILKDMEKKEKEEKD